MSLRFNSDRPGRRLATGLSGLGLVVLTALAAGCSLSRASADRLIIDDWVVRDFLHMDGVTVLGKPMIVNSPWGEAVAFNGVSDAFDLNHNPLVGYSRFTIEVVMMPDGDGPNAQRYLHFGEADGDRVLLETRVVDGQWYHDSFVQSGDQGLALIDATKLHPTDQWHHVALVFDNGSFATYLNGVRELEGSVAFTPHVGGQTSIGVRMNRVFWYKGAFYRIRISNRVLQPHEFLPQARGR